tara:strand:- start:42 stop:458 length:417 start_codon:yes stop_codon:yes gene_type:complete
MKKEEFKIEKQHLGQFRMDSEKHGFNSIVISGACQGDVKDYQMVGRIIQVRKDSGAYGSDTILIRLMDGDIMSFENQSFFSVATEFKEYYESILDKELDEPNREYSIFGNHKATGFVVNGMDCTDGKLKSMTINITNS